MKSEKQNIFLTSVKDFDAFSANFIKEKLEYLSDTKPLNIVLSGGSTPLPVLKKLKFFNLDWNSYNFFLADERCVDVDSNESNFKNINNVFFKYISSKKQSILKENYSLDDMVVSYNKYITDHVLFEGHNQPKFDMIILGMGEDGHTASLFPNTKALNIENDFIVINHIPALNNFRITLTFPAILGCEEIIVLIKGKEKMKVFEQIMAGDGEQYPIAKLLKNTINWIVAS